MNDLHIQLIEDWDNAKYIEVADEVSEMSSSDIVSFIISFIKAKGQAEVGVLHRLME